MPPDGAAGSSNFGGACFFDSQNRQNTHTWLHSKEPKQALSTYIKYMSNYAGIRNHVQWFTWTAHEMVSWTEYDELEVVLPELLELHRPCLSSCF